MIGGCVTKIYRPKYIGKNISTKISYQNISTKITYNMQNAYIYFLNEPALADFTKKYTKKYEGDLGLGEAIILKNKKYIVSGAVL